MGKTLDTALPIIAAVAATALTGNPAIGAGADAAATSGLNYSQTHNVGSAVKQGAAAGAGSYIGGNLGSSLGGSLGTVGNAVGDTFGSSAGSALGSAAPAIAGSSLGGAIGSFAGGDLGATLTQPTPSASSSAYVPTAQAPAALPASLSGMSGLTANQQASGLATQGVYGGGNGPEESSYFSNLLNRQLVDSSGNQQSMSTLSPIDNTYLQKLGLGGNTNTTSLLQAMNQWQQNQAS